MEAVFRALGDEHRRVLLDRLFERDGQTLTELEAALPQMTRFGVMKHLRVLENAGLVTTRRAGRRKLHYLNPVPIRLVLDRWISKYASPWVETMTGMKQALEREMTEDAPKHVFEVYIRTTPERLWEALTDREANRKFYGLDVESDWKTGSTYRFSFRSGFSMDGMTIEKGDSAHYGTIVEAEPPRRLVQTFESDFPEEWGGGKDQVTRVTWEIEPMGELCKLTLIHEGWKTESKAFESSRGGWAQILSSLKSLLETGEALTYP